MRMKIILKVALSTFLILLLTILYLGCKTENNINSFDGLVNRLKSEGFQVEPSGEIFQDFFSAKGKIIKVNDEDIQVDVEKTVVYISIADKLLFKSGSSVISSKAKDVLGKVADVITAQPELEVMVEGYTDNKKVISNASIKDNWDLSVKRATSVIRVLQNDFSIDPTRLVAAGRSEYKPLDSNDTVDGRARNRRTRIVLMPKLDQFFNLLESKID